MFYYFLFLIILIFLSSAKNKKLSTIILFRNHLNISKTILLLNLLNILYGSMQEMHLFYKQLR